MRKNLLIISVILILLVSLYLGFSIYKNKRGESRGELKFKQAISELRIESPELDKPCLGAHVIRWNSYSELDKKSVEEIKQIAIQAPGDC